MIDKNDPLTKEQKNFLINNIDERLKNYFEDGGYIGIPSSFTRSVRNTLKACARSLMLNPEHNLENLVVLPLDCNTSKDLKDFLLEIIKTETINALSDFVDPYCNDWELLAKEKTDESKGS